MKRDFYVYTERDEDGLFVGEVPQLRACYAQGRTLEELSNNILEVIQICLEDEESSGPLPEFFGVQKVTVDDAASNP